MKEYKIVSLDSSLLNLDRFVFLYGTTPPRADASQDRIHKAAARLSLRTQELNLDGLVVYDVQDEDGRTLEARPFPFLPTLQAPVYSHLLNNLTKKSVITYKSATNMSKKNLLEWLEESDHKYGVRFLSLVGPATSKSGFKGIPLLEAIRIASTHPAGFTVGGVVIPERHSAEKNESRRLLLKSKYGCSYFISQAVYNPEAVIRLLRDYQRDCRLQDAAPKRIVLTFTPCGRPRTLEFMRWLGIAIPAETEADILSSTKPLSTSLKICASNLRRILEECSEYGVPLGVNIESVSIGKEEINATVDLFGMLQEVCSIF